MGLAAYLGNHPDTLSATWHTQFHFSLFSGRPGESAGRHHEEAILTNAFRSALSRAPWHEIRAYTTSAELARQYNCMELLGFQTLPWPVNPKFFRNHLEGQPQRPLGPLKFTVAGGVRREKGQKTGLHTLIQDIWDRHLASGQVQLDLQAGKRESFARRRVLRGRRVSGRQYRKAVRIHGHPLPESRYVELIHEADVGLFCYDSRRYYSRRAGILSEFLSCGKPVIVPAGCWLSRQIARPAAEYMAGLMERAAFRQTIDVTNLAWDPSNVPLAGRAISFDQNRRPFSCQLQRHDLVIERPTVMIIDFSWQRTRQPVHFVEVEWSSLDKANRLVGYDRQITEVSSESPDSRVLLRIPADFCRGKLVFRNPWNNSSITISDVKVSFLDFADQPPPPRSAVGVIAADESMLAAAVDEMVDHYDHYLATAVKFSQRWSAWHDPLRTVEALMPSRDRTRHAA
jgi:hypothetical protein